MSADAPGISRGQRPLPTCFSLRRHCAQAESQGQKRGQRPACSASARTTLNEHRGRSRAAAAVAAGVGKSLWLCYAFAGPAGDAPVRPPPGRGGRVLTAQLCRRQQPWARAAWGPQEPQSCSPRTGSPTALATTASRAPGGPVCAARDVAGAGSAPGMPSRDAPRSAPTTQPPFLCHPQPGGQWPCSCHSGHPGYCSGLAAVPALKEKRPSLRARRHEARRAGTFGSARRGSSQAPGKVARRGGGGGWWAEAVGGGGDRPPISKVESTPRS